MSDDEEKSWAGKGYSKKLRSEQLSEEVADDLAWLDQYKLENIKNLPTRVPFVYRELDEEGNERVVKIGEADVAADGSCAVTLDDGMKLAGMLPTGMSFEPRNPPNSRIFRGPKASAFCVDEVSRFSIEDLLPDSFGEDNAAHMFLIKDDEED